MYSFNRDNVDFLMQRFDKFMKDELNNKHAELCKLCFDLGLQQIESPAEMKKEVDDVANRFWEVEMIEIFESCLEFLHNDEGFKKIMLFGNSSEVDYFTNQFNKRIILTN